MKILLVGKMRRIRAIVQSKINVRIEIRYFSVEEDDLKATRCEEEREVEKDFFRTCLE